MRKSIWTGTCIAIVGFATAVAMAQVSQAPQTPQPTAAPNSDGKVTVTGCLTTAPTDSTAPSASGTTGTSGTTTAGTPAPAGTAGAAPGDAKFLLTDATASTAAASAGDQPAVPAPPSTPTAAAPTAMTYRLIANPSALTPHLGKKLALTGTIEKDSSASSTPGASSPATALLALRVESGKIIAESCAGQ